MADAPFLAAGMTEQSRGCEKKQPPASLPDACLGAVNAQKNIKYRVSVPVIIRKPVVGGFLVLRSAPAPLGID